ncbi:hypothetical protein K7W42_22020 [Deinococcus sp. HMF7604]|uniref:hypothetical protein n=1 Tax=Deinococcus betulae TaxID=2873312 RepID=UPI001CCC8BAF|nr:hypothetical protein [Deinococcus betulae]MBZ9753512.1 hypothetical protein [Deinococcus betulae]
MIQLTGRANYRTYGTLIGYDLEDDPDLLLQYGISALMAGAYSRARGLNDRRRLLGLAKKTLGLN